jgi:hypothetical protein
MVRAVHNAGFFTSAKGNRIFRETSEKTAEEPPEKDKRRIPFDRAVAPEYAVARCSDIAAFPFAHDEVSISVNVRRLLNQTKAGRGIGIRGGAVSHIRRTSSGVRP